MKIRKGDHIAIDSEHVGTPPREGEVLEVLVADFGTRYRVRWEDGHESTIHPVGGSIRVTESPEACTSQVLVEVYS